LSALLPDGLQRLSGLRAVPERHRSLGAAIDWSYDLLTDGEQRLMRSLAIFPGEFSLASIYTLGMLGNIDADTVVRDLASLVGKSLVVADTHAVEPAYRLLDTTRAYALEKLAESAERNGICRHLAGETRGKTEPGRFNAGGGTSHRPYGMAAE
jgi:predicted ATPase